MTNGRRGRQLIGSVGCAAIVGLFLLILHNWPALFVRYQFWQMQRLPVVNASDSQEFWGEVVTPCLKRFRILATGNRSREKLRAFVVEFGKHGPEADYRWIVSFPDATLPRRFGGAPYQCEEHKPSRQAECIWAREAQCAIAEDLTRRLLLEPDLIDKYYHVVLFSRRLVPADDLDMQLSVVGLFAGQCDDGFQNRPADEYWWWVRNFILIAHLTGRDDLWIGKSGSSMKAAFKEWMLWFDENADSLAPAIDSATMSLKLSKDEADDDAVGLAVPNIPFVDWKSGSPDASYLDWYDVFER